jgi:spermidine/putrescine transport system permease protein
MQGLLYIFLPGIQRGIVTAFVMVFIPAMGAYVIPDLVGGPSSEMIANKIVQKTLVVRNIPEAAVFSIVLGIAIIIPIFFISRLQKRFFEPGQAPRNIE